MIIRNGRVLSGKQFIRTDIRFDKYITAVGAAKQSEAEELDAEGCYVLPGLVDIHTHGAVGEDFSDGSLSGLQPMAEYYAENGVTSFLATTMTLGEEALTAAMHAIRDFRPQRGAKCAGVHLEGPFLCYTRRGAQAAEYLHKPNAELLARLNDAVGGRIKLVTVACEEEGAIEFIQTASKSCTVSLGHTEADYDTARRAFEAGAAHVTHLYNCMPPLHHRCPGVIGAALDAGVSVELICDGLHIHPAVVRATYAMFGDRCCFVSDSLRCAGMPDGDYELGGQKIRKRGGKATLFGSATLAGASVSLLDCLRNAVRFGIPPEDAAYAASTAPAAAVGLTDVGAIEPGRCADLIVLDGDFNLKAVFIDGVRQQV